MRYGKSTKRYKKTYYKGVNKAVKYYVNKQIAKNVETKMIVYNSAAEFNLLSTTWTELQVSNIAQGTGLISRIGRQVKLKSLEVDMLIDKTDATNMFRIVIGTYMGTLTTPMTTALATMNTAITKNNLNGVIRKYLDKYIVCDGVKQSIAHFKYYKQFKKPVYITWAADAGNPDKRLIMSILSDSGAAAHPFSSAGRIVLRFEDA